MVAKKDGCTCLCTDYRKINKVTRLPVATDLYNAAESTMKTLVFINRFVSSYWQVSLSEKAKEISAFTRSPGLFQFNVLPFRLTNAPSEFQRLMEMVRGRSFSMRSRRRPFPTLPAPPYFIYGQRSTKAA